MKQTPVPPRLRWPFRSSDNPSHSCLGFQPEVMQPKPDHASVTRAEYRSAAHRCRAASPPEKEKGVFWEDTSHTLRAWPFDQAQDAAAPPLPLLSAIASRRFFFGD